MLILTAVLDPGCVSGTQRFSRETANISNTSSKYLTGRQAVNNLQSEGTARRRIQGGASESTGSKQYRAPALPWRCGSRQHRHELSGGGWRGAGRSGGRPRLDRSIRTQHPGTETDPAGSGSGSGWLVRCSFLGRRARLVPGADAACPFLCLRCPPSPSSGNAMGRRIASHRLRCSSATPICAQPKLLAGSLGEERGQPASQPASQQVQGGRGKNSQCTCYSGRSRFCYALCYDSYLSQSVPV